MAPRGTTGWVQEGPGATKGWLGYTEAEITKDQKHSLKGRKVALEILLTASTSLAFLYPFGGEKKSASNLKHTLCSMHLPPLT